MIKNVKLGADPELFLSKNGEIISAEGYIGGSKNAPKIISKKGHAIQEDNVMIEFNIPPCTTQNDFLNEINYVKEYLNQLAKVYNCELDFSASAELNSKYLKTAQARQFGCEPDLNVYLKEVNEPPKSNGNLRSCGGHLHVGYDNPTIETSELIVKAMDVTLGLHSVSLDEDFRRKEMYGKAGCFRFKDYGVEYRTLSNFWIKNDNLIKWAYNGAMKAIELVNSKEIYGIIDSFEDDIKDVIDNSKVKDSKLLINKIENKIKKVICVE